jgi:light-regulated signal transduction histidine kinase (bacteriophytochrome)
VIRWLAQTLTQPEKRSGRKISRVSTGARSKSRRTYTKDLLEKEQSLETQNQELHKTNSELDRFVYSTSHDLRALKSMLGLIAIVKESEEKYRSN